MWTFLGGMRRTGKRQVLIVGTRRESDVLKDQPSKYFKYFYATLEKRQAIASDCESKETFNVP